MERPRPPLFASGDSPRLVASLVRSSGAAIQVTVWDAEQSGFLPLWWGAKALVKRGDRVFYFETPSGVAIEGVEEA